MGSFEVKNCKKRTTFAEEIFSFMVSFQGKEREKQALFWSKIGAKSGEKRGKISKKKRGKPRLIPIGYGGNREDIAAQNCRLFKKKLPLQK